MEALKLTSLDPFKYSNYSLPWMVKGHRSEGTHQGPLRFLSSPKIPLQDTCLWVTSQGLHISHLTRSPSTESLIENAQNQIPDFLPAYSTSVGALPISVDNDSSSVIPSETSEWSVTSLSSTSPIQSTRKFCALNLTNTSRTKCLLPFLMLPSCSQPLSSVACKMQVSQRVSLLLPGPLLSILWRMLSKWKLEQIFPLYGMLPQFPMA